MIEEENKEFLALVKKQVKSGRVVSSAMKHFMKNRILLRKREDSSYHYVAIGS